MPAMRWSLATAATAAATAAIATLALHAPADAPFPSDPGKFEKVGVVLAPSEGAWDSDMVESPSVVRDPSTRQWAMAYTGYGSADGVQRAAIGLAFSSDGRAWRKVAGPILTGSGTPGAPDQAGATGPVLVRDRSQWVLFYIGLTDAGYESGAKTIDYATSPSLAGPWRRGGVLVAPAGTGWRSAAVWHVSVVRDGGHWVMFFNATGADRRESIGVATAKAIMGPWVVDDANSPVLSPDTGHWDGEFVGDPFVWRDGNRWVMDYYGFNGDHAADGRAVTSAEDFPLDWRRTGVELAPSEPFDSQYAHKPWLAWVGGRELHYYTAASGDGSRGIALAVRR
jgi:hypothetical protein